MNSQPSQQRQNSEPVNKKTMPVPLAAPLPFMAPFNPVLKQVMQQNELVKQGFDSQMINQLSMAFKLHQIFPGNLNDRTNQIKAKIMDIFLEEKDEWHEYLTLPKFKYVSEQVKEKLSTIMDQVWKQFKIQSNQKSYRSKYIKYTCMSENFKDIENFHCSMFNFVKTGYFYQSPSQNQMMRPLANYPIMPRNAEFPPYSMGPSSIVDNNQLIGQSRQQFYDTAYNQTVKIQQNFNNGHYNQMMYPNKQLFDQHPKQEYIPNQSEMKICRKLDQDSKAIYPKVLDQNFIECVCRGRMNEDSRFFICSRCCKKFHMQCFGIPPDAIQKKQKIHCPECYLQQNNVFYQIMGDPLQKFWTDDRQLHKQKITIKSKKCKQLASTKNIIQIRFVKIDGKNYFDYYDYDDHIKAINPPKKKTILNEILLKHDMIQRGNSEDLKISLDCMKFQNKSHDPIKKPVLLYFSVYVVRERDQQQILKMPYHDFQQAYLDNFLLGKDQIKIQIFDNDLKLINTPVRGAQCQHPQVFDLQEFVKNFQKVNQNCYFCHKKCRNFKIDRKIATQIQKIKATVSNPDEYPTELYYTKSGFRWNLSTKPKQKQSQAQIEPEPDSQMNISISEEEVNAGEQS